MFDFLFSFLSSFPHVLPLSLPSYLPLLKWNWIKEGKKGVGRREGSSLGFVEIFIGQGWLVKLNIYADLTCLFNLRLGKYVS